MPKYRVTGPDGRKFIVTGPEPPSLEKLQELYSSVTQSQSTTQTQMPQTSPQATPQAQADVSAPSMFDRAKQMYSDLGQELSGKSQIDIEEEKNRKSTLDFFYSSLKGLGREAKGAIETVKAGSEFAGKNIPVMIADHFFRSRGINFSKRNKDQVAITMELAKQSPEMAKEIIKDMSRSYGIDPKNLERGPDLDVFLEKFQEAPVSTGLDIVMLGGLLKGGVKQIGGKISSLSRTEKKAVHKILSQSEIRNAEMYKMLKEKVPTPLQELMSNETLKKLDYDKHLKNQNYPLKIGRETVNNMKRMKARDQSILQSAIREVGENKVRTDTIYDNVISALKEEGLINEAGELDSTIKSAAKFTRELKKLEDIEEMNMWEIWKRQGLLLKKISKGAPKEPDIAVKILRSEYRDVLRQASGKYDDNARRVAKKIELFEDRFNKIQKAGSGDEFGRKFFSNKQELEDFREYALNQNDRLSWKIDEQLNVLDAWHQWDRYFKEHEGFKFHVPFTNIRTDLGARKRFLKKMQKVKGGIPEIGKAELGKGALTPERLKEETPQ